MSIKSGLGKLNLTQPIEPFVEDQARRNRFDRLLIAQSITEVMPLISADRTFDSYSLSLIR